MKEIWLLGRCLYCLPAAKSGMDPSNHFKMLFWILIPFPSIQTLVYCFLFSFRFPPVDLNSFHKKNQFIYEIYCYLFKKHKLKSHQQYFCVVSEMELTTHEMNFNLWFDSKSSKSPNPKGKTCVEDECSLFCNPNLLGSNEQSKMIMLHKQLKFWSNRIRCWMNIAFQLSLRSFPFEVSDHDPIQIVPTIILHGNFWVSPT